MIRKIRKFSTLGPQEKKILKEAYGLMIWGSFMLRFVPMQRMAPVLGVYRKDDSRPPNETETETIWLMRRNMLRAKRYIPWKTRCFAEAYTAKKILERRHINSTLCLGVQKGRNKELKAHAWVRMGDKIIVGGKHSRAFTNVGYFS